MRGNVRNSVTVELPLTETCAAVKASAAEPFATSLRIELEETELESQVLEKATCCEFR